MKTERAVQVEERERIAEALRKRAAAHRVRAAALRDRGLPKEHERETARRLACHQECARELDRAADDIERGELE